MDYIPSPVQYLMNSAISKITSSLPLETVNKLKTGDIKSILFEQLYRNYYKNALFTEGDMAKNEYPDIPIIPDHVKRYNQLKDIPIENSIHRPIEKLASLDIASVNMAFEPANSNHSIFMDTLILVALYYNKMNEYSIKIFFEGNNSNAKLDTAKFNNLNTLNAIAFNLFFSNHTSYKGRNLVTRELTKTTIDLWVYVNKHITNTGIHYDNFMKSTGFFDARTILKMVNILTEQHKILYKNESYFNIIMTLRKLLIFTDNNFFCQFLLIHYIKSQIPDSYLIASRDNPVFNVMNYYPWNPYNKSGRRPNMNKEKRNMSATQIQNIIMTHITPFLLYSNQTWFVNAAIFQSVSMPVESSGGPQVFYTVGTIIDEKVTTGESSIPFNNFLADNSVSNSDKNNTIKCIIYAIKQLIKYIHAEDIRLQDIVVMKLDVRLNLTLDGNTISLQYCPVITNFTWCKKIRREIFQLIFLTMKTDIRLEIMNPVILNSIISKGSISSVQYKDKNNSFELINSANLDIVVPKCRGDYARNLQNNDVNSSEVPKMKEPEGGFLKNLAAKVYGSSNNMDDLTSDPYLKPENVIVGNPTMSKKIIIHDDVYLGKYVNAQIKIKVLGTRIAIVNKYFQIVRILLTLYPEHNPLIIDIYITLYKWFDKITKKLQYKLANQEKISGVLNFPDSKDIRSLINKQSELIISSFYIIKYVNLFRYISTPQAFNLYITNVSLIHEDQNTNKLIRDLEDTRIKLGENTSPFAITFPNPSFVPKELIEIMHSFESYLKKQAQYSVTCVDPVAY